MIGLGCIDARLMVTLAVLHECEVDFIFPSLHATLMFGRLLGALLFECIEEHFRVVERYDVVMCAVCAEEGWNRRTRRRAGLESEVRRGHIVDGRVLVALFADDEVVQEEVESTEETLRILAIAKDVVRVAQIVTGEGEKRTRTEEYKTSDQYSIFAKKTNSYEAA